MLAWGNIADGQDMPATKTVVGHIRPSRLLGTTLYRKSKSPSRYVLAATNNCCATNPACPVLFSTYDEKGLPRNASVCTAALGCQHQDRPNFASFARPVVLCIHNQAIIVGASRVTLYFCCFVQNLVAVKAMLTCYILSLTADQTHLGLDHWPYSRISTIVAIAAGIFEEHYRNSGQVKKPSDSINKRVKGTK